MELNSIPLLADVDPDQRAAVVDQLEEKDAVLGTVLAERGEFAHRFFVILEGLAAVATEDAYLTTLGPGDFFGEIGLMEQDRRTANVVAITPMRLATMMAWDFQDLTRQAPAVAEAIEKAIQERLQRG